VYERREPAGQHTVINSCGLIWNSASILAESVVTVATNRLLLRAAARSNSFSME